MLSDSPIQDKKQDLLCRYPFAYRIAHFINHLEYIESFVLGLEGPWGSGKTSFINLILSNLDTDKNLVLRFNPWSFANQEELIKDFFHSLIDHIGTSSEKKSDELLQVFKAYYAKLLSKSELSLAPEISFLGLTFKFGELYSSTHYIPLQKQKEAIDTILKGFKKRIVIVIDDIDRLENQEVKAIFKLVNLTANFSSTLFILAYDRNKVSAQLNESGLNGEDYLKRVIQLHFSLPEVDKKELGKILSNYIHANILPLGGKGWQERWSEDKWQLIYNIAIRDFFHSIRDIKLFINALTIDLFILQELAPRVQSGLNMDPVDFLTTESLHIFTPNLYLSLSKKLNKLFSQEKHASRLIEEIDQLIFKSTPQKLNKAAKEILSFLFPQIHALYANISALPQKEGKQWHSQSKSSFEELLNHYFFLSRLS